MITLLLVCAVGPLVRPVDAYGDPLPPHAVVRLGSGRIDGSPFHDPILSPDGRRAAVAQKGRLWLFDTASGRRTPVPVSAFAPHRGEWFIETLHGRPIFLLASRMDPAPQAFTPDGRLVITNDSFPPRVQGIWLLDPSGATPCRKVHSGVAYVRAATDSRLVTSDDNDRLMIHDLTDGKFLRTIEDRPNKLSWGELSPDGSTLVAISWRPKEREYVPGVHLWDARTGKRKGIVLNEIVHVCAVTFSPDGKRLAVAGDEKGKGYCVTIWDLAAGKQLSRVPSGHLTQLAFSADGGRFAVGDRGGVRKMDGVVEVYTVAGKLLRRCPTPGRVELTDLRFRGDDVVAAGKSDATAVVWEPLTDKLVVPAGGHFGRIDSLAFSADGERLFSGSNDGGRVWDWRAGSLVRAVPRPWTDSRPGVCALATFSPRGRYAALIEEGGFGLHVVEVSTGKVIARRDGGVGRYSPMAGFTAAEDRMAVAFDGGGNRRLQVWDLPAMRLRAEVPYDGDTYETHLALSADGALLAVTRYDAPLDRSDFLGRRERERLPGGRPSLVRVLDVGGGKERSRFTLPRPVSDLSFQGDGVCLAVSGPRKGVLLDARTGRPRLERENSGDARLAVSPDGRLLAVSEDWPDGIGVTVEERASGFLRLRLVVHAEGPMQGRDVRSLAFSPDGQYLAVGTVDATLLVFDLTGLADLRAPRRPDGIAWQALMQDGWSPGLWLAYPAEAVTLLRERLKPAPGRGMDGAALRRHLAGLAADDFRDREAASKALAAAPGFAGLVERALDGEMDLEARRRLERLVAGYRRPQRGEPLRALRAVEVLERLRTPEARRLLADLANGNADARVTAEAKASLERMRR